LKQNCSGHVWTAKWDERGRRIELWHCVNCGKKICHPEKTKILDYLYEKSLTDSLPYLEENF